MLSRYKSHKVVMAARINAFIEDDHFPESICCEIVSEAGKENIVGPSRGLYAEMQPKVGWYLVVYSDGYESFSPPAEFEAGYTAVGHAVAGEDDEVEREIKEKGLDIAPRITQDAIDDQISSEAFWSVPNTTTTVCCLVLANGYTVIGSSACASPENFDEDLGKKLAKRDARSKIGGLMGYYLRQTLAEDALKVESDIEDIEI